MLNSYPPGLVALDIGEVTTRAHFFNCIDGQHRYSGSREVPRCTLENVNENQFTFNADASKALNSIQLESIKNYDEILFHGMEKKPGVESFVLSTNITSELKIVVAPLLNSFSKNQLNRILCLPQTKFIEVVLSGDKRYFEAQLDAILSEAPDAIVIYSEKEISSQEILQNTIKPVRIAYHLSAKGNKPKLLYLGRLLDKEKVRRAIKAGDDLHFIDITNQDEDKDHLHGTYQKVQDFFKHLQMQKIHAERELPRLSSEFMTDSSDAFGGMVQLLRKFSGLKKNVLGVYLENFSTTIVVVDRYDHTFVYTYREGFHQSDNKSSELSSIRSFVNSLHTNIAEERIIEYLQNKNLNPSHIPVTEQEIEIELVVACGRIRNGVKNLQATITRHGLAETRRVGSDFGLILVAGNPIKWSLSSDKILRLVLDGIEPSGSSTLILDQYDISRALGSLAKNHPEICQQVLSSDVFNHLCSIISPKGEAPNDAPILKLRIIYPDGSESKLDIKRGELYSFPIQAGKKARVHLQPLYSLDAGMGAGVGGFLEVEGSELGIVIDGRVKLIKPQKTGERSHNVKLVSHASTTMTVMNV